MASLKIEFEDREFDSDGRVYIERWCVDGITALRMLLGMKKYDVEDCVGICCQLEEYIKIEQPYEARFVKQEPGNEFFIRNYMEYKGTRLILVERAVVSKNGQFVIYTVDKDGDIRMGTYFAALEDAESAWDAKRREYWATLSKTIGTQVKEDSDADIEAIRRDLIN